MDVKLNAPIQKKTQTFLNNKKPMYSTNPFMQRVATSAKRFSNFSGDGAVIPQAQTLNQLNRTLTVKIVNGTNATASYVVFGYNENGDAATAGSDAGVSVTISQSSHAQVKRDTASNPVVLVSAKYSTTDATNFNNDLTYRRKDSTGQLNTIPVTPLNYQEPQNNITTLLVIPDFNGVLIDGASAFTGSINASSTIVLVLSIKTKVSIGNAAFDENVQVSTSQPAPTGNTPVIMQVHAAPGIIGGTAMPAGSAGSTTASSGAATNDGGSSFWRR